MCVSVTLVSELSQGARAMPVVVSCLRCIFFVVLWGFPAHKCVFCSQPNAKFAAKRKACLVYSELNAFVGLFAFAANQRIGWRARNADAGARGVACCEAVGPRATYSCGCRDRL